MYEFESINSFLVGMAKLLLNEGTSRMTRGQECVELAQPIIIKLNNPCARLITIDERNWNYTLPFAEALWIASGRNDMDFIGSYLKKMHEFSDDNVSMRAAYGPRLRYYSGESNDYNNNIIQKSSKKIPNNIFEIDQFTFIEKIFEKDPFTRQAVISIVDPAKDYLDCNYNLKSTKDFPCTNNIQFLRRNNFLDMVVHMRSNDLYWGASAVNIFNFTFMQEYFSRILGLQIGKYYHIVNNLHYYKTFQKEIEKISQVTTWDDQYYIYKSAFEDLKDFDLKVAKLERFENDLRHGITKRLISFEDEFFDDWVKVLYVFHTEDYSIKFINPVLNWLNEKKKLKTIKRNGKAIQFK